MIKTEALENIIALALTSAYLIDERPLSLLLTAKVEAGKTELMLKFNGNRGLLFLTDITAWGIQRHFINAIKSGHIRHLVVLDLLTPINKSHETAHSFIAFLNALIEEGMLNIATYAMHLEAKIPTRCGLICAIPRGELEDRRHKWASMGFMSRLIPVSWDYKPSTVLAIMESIIMGEYLADTKRILELPSTDQHVSLSPDMARKVSPLSYGLAGASELYGFRLQRQFQTMLKASALLDKRDSVTIEDVERIIYLADFLNLKYAAI